MAANDRDVARVIARRFFLLVSVLVFLVHDYQAERVHRRKNCRAGADNNPGSPLAYLMPFIMSFACRQMAVQHRDQGPQRPGAEPGLEPLHRLRCQRDFRHQHNGAFSLLERMGERLQINFGFPAPRNSMQEKN